MYIDSNIFIFASMSDDLKGDNARSIINKIVCGKKAITSSLTIDEIMWVILKKGEKHRMRSIIEDIYSIENLSIVDTPAGVPLIALKYIESHNLKPRDAMHVAVMNHFKITDIVSDDSDFDRVEKIQRIGL